MSIGNAVENENKPLVSVIIPAYNSAKYIERTLDSVFNQTFKDIEVILVNDGSQDTAELEKALQRYDHVHYICSENRGAGSARNLGIKAARGKWLAFLDADDCWFPTYLAEQLAVLDQTGTDAVYCDALFVGDPKLENQTFMQLAPSRCAVTPESLLAVDVGVLTTAVVISRKAVLDVGGFDESIRRGQDFDLWFRLARKGTTFACHPKVLAHYSVTPGGLSGNTISQLERTLTLLKTIRSRGDLTPTEEVALLKNETHCKARLATEIGKQKLLDRDFEGALTSFNEAARLRRNWKLTIVRFVLRVAPRLLWQVYHGRSTMSSTATKVTN